jgi:hypothetical protein
MKELIGSTFVLLALSLLAQTEPEQKPPKPFHVEPEVRMRTFYMRTANEGALRDDFAWGSSLRMGGTLTWNKGFSLTYGYRAFALHLDSEVWEPEPITGQINRYETGLFNQTHPEKRYFGKTEELKLTYKSTKWQGVVGRMIINTPFINSQDGRLNPTAVEGVHLQWTPAKDWKLGAWAIWRIGPRSTGGWYNMGDTFGLYPTGLGTDGQPSRYPGNVDSNWVGIWHAERKLKTGDALKFWNTYIQNIATTAQVEYTGKRAISGNMAGVFGVQGFWQHGVGLGGSANPQVRYKDPTDSHGVVSASAGVDMNRSSWTLNYTYLWGEGRFLSPREWGRDPFYTFLPRERNEGYEHVQAITATWETRLWGGRLRPGIGAGVYFLPDPSDAPANKYAFPSYSQLNLSVRFQGQGSLKNMEALLLLVRKDALDSEIERLGWVYNKVNLTHFNAVVNYRLW